MVSAILNTLGMTKTQLAAVLGLTRQAIYGWLRGTEPSTEHYKRLSRLACIVDSVLQDTRRPLFQRFVLTSTRAGLPSVLDLLQQRYWDEDALLEALQQARRLTSERDQRTVLETHRLTSRRALSDEEQIRNLEDNLLALD